MRALGIARLSRDTDTSTSIERQVEQIELAARLRGDEVVTIVKDSDVSGAVSPFERSKLAPWLDGKSREWDTLIVAKLDRLTRSLFDFADLVKWCDAHGKILVSVSESIDLAMPHGRMMANLLVSFAQFERERMSERRSDARREVRGSGGWDGGRVPYGYRPVHARVDGS
jgi:site-specific DNA recombinase